MGLLGNYVYLKLQYMVWVPQNAFDIRSVKM